MMHAYCDDFLRRRSPVCRRQQDGGTAASGALACSGAPCLGSGEPAARDGSLANDQDPPNTHRCAAQPTVVSKQRRQGTGMSQLAARCWLIWNTYPSVSLACGHGGWHAVCAWRERSGRSKPGPGPSKVLQKSCTIYELIHYPTTHIGSQTAHVPMRQCLQARRSNKNGVCVCYYGR